MPTGLTGFLRSHGLMDLLRQRSDSQKLAPVAEPVHDPVRSDERSRPD